MDVHQFFLLVENSKTEGQIIFCLELTSSENAKKSRWGKTCRKWFKPSRTQSKIEVFIFLWKMVGKTRDDGPKNTPENPKTDVHVATPFHIIVICPCAPRGMDWILGSHVKAVHQPHQMEITLWLYIQPCSEACCLMRHKLYIDMVHLTGCRGHNFEMSLYNHALAGPSVRTFPSKPLAVNDL